MSKTTQDGADVVERPTPDEVAELLANEFSGDLYDSTIGQMGAEIITLRRVLGATARREGSANAENARLREALRAAYVELAALIPIPSADDPEWPMFPLNAADHECLNNAYLGIRAALQETSNG